MPVLPSGLEPSAYSMCRMLDFAPDKKDVLSANMLKLKAFIWIP